MKLISLNTWGGKIYQPLIDFIKRQSKDTDIFCFQEVFKTTSEITTSFEFRTNLYNEIAKILDDHQGYFAVTIDNYLVGSFQINFIDFDLSSGLAIFISKKLNVSSHGDFFVYRGKNSFDPKDLNSMPRNVQYINFTNKDKRFTVCNLHGIWVKGTKGDTASRLEQSQQVKKFLNNQAGEKILCGDFNLNMDTESLKILESNMTNLIKKYHILTTRSKLYPQPDKFADYTFVSKGVEVKSFEVPKIEISDHLPMILEFS